MKLSLITIFAFMQICFAQQIFASTEMVISFNEKPVDSTDDVIYRIRISAAEMEKNTSWMADKGEDPPLKVLQAIQNASAYAQQNLSYFVNSLPSDVSLRCFYTSEGCKDKWYYAVRLDNFQTNDSEKPRLFRYTGKTEHITILVLMDGSVPELRIEPRIQNVSYTTQPNVPDSQPRQLSNPMPAINGTKASQ